MENGEQGKTPFKVVVKRDLVEGCSVGSRRLIFKIIFSLVVTAHTDSTLYMKLRDQLKVERRLLTERRLSSFDLQNCFTFVGLI